MEKNFKPIIWALAIALLLIVGAAIVYAPVLLGLRKVGGSMATLVEKTKGKFSPVIRVDQTIIYQEKSPVLELITHKQLLQHRMEWKSTWVGSTKSVTLEGDFLASGGFNLLDPITVDFDTKEKVVRVVHPAPQLMALELKELKTSQEEGWWNKVSDDERNEITRAFKAEARQRILSESPLLENAVKDLHAQFDVALRNSGYRIEFQQAGAKATPRP